jgi:DNA-binding Xre family transcriptional regulator
VGKRTIRQQVVQYFESIEGMQVGNDGGSLMTNKTRIVVSPQPKNGGSPRVAELVRELIRKRWQGTDKELAEAAKVSQSGLTILKTQGAAFATTNLRKVCRVLRVDAFKLVEGKVVDAVSAPDRRDLHAMLDTLLGTADEPTVERVLRALVEAKR